MSKTSAQPTTETKRKSKFSPRIAVIVSHFNRDITDGLRRGAVSWFDEHDISVESQDFYRSPGAFEMPLIAQSLAQTGDYDGVVCLGCVVKGDTAHFEFISLGATLGLIKASLKTEIPISFGILTVYDRHQAIVRSGDDAENKGREAAAACYESAFTLHRIRTKEKSTK